MTCPYKESNCKGCMFVDTDPNNKVVCAKYKAYIDAQDPEIVNSILEDIGIPKDTSNFTKLLKMQTYLQEKLKERTGKGILNLTPQEKNERMLMMERAMLDEMAEVRQHLSWKDWKKPDYSSFTDPDKLDELRKEVIDKLHFWLNEAIILEMNEEMIVDIYLRKNIENILRQKHGY